MGAFSGNKDAAFFDDRTRELNRVAGTTEIVYFAFDFAMTRRDPVYGEPVQELHKKDERRKTLGVQFNVFFEYPERSQRTGEEGQHVDYDAVVWISRADFDDNYPILSPLPGGPSARTPILGDIVMVQGKFYDVMSFQEDGQFGDTIRRHATWMVKVKNRSEFDARRRIGGQV